MSRFSGRRLRRLRALPEMTEAERRKFARETLAMFQDWEADVSAWYRAHPKDRRFKDRRRRRKS